MFQKFLASFGRRIRFVLVNCLMERLATLADVRYGAMSANSPRRRVRNFTTGAYGFGFQIGLPDEARTYGHDGGAPGMNAILRVYPESGQWVIVLCNLDHPSASAWEIGSTPACHSSSYVATGGQRIGRYKILECVGEGGCGVVYVAEQAEPVRRRVALKVIKLGMDTKQVTHTKA